MPFLIRSHPLNLKTVTKCYNMNTPPSPPKSYPDLLVSSMLAVLEPLLDLSHSLLQVFHHLRGLRGEVDILGLSLVSRISQH